MKHLKWITLILAFMLLETGLCMAQGTGTRYHDPIFNSIATADIQYGSAPSLLGPGNEDLYLDLYEPITTHCKPADQSLFGLMGGASQVETRSIKLYLATILPNTAMSAW